MSLFFHTFVILSLLTFPVVLLSSGEAATSIEVGWQRLAALQPDAAAEMFERFPEEREAQLGRALSLLAQQPVTRGNVLRAEALLESLVRDGGSFAAEAYFYLARVAQVHYFTPEPAKAVERYDALIEAHPESPFAELAEVKSAILRLYVLDHPDGAERLIEELDQRGRGLRMPHTIRDFYWNLADGVAYFELESFLAYEFLQRVDATGRAEGTLRANLLARLGESARKMGYADAAIKYFSRYLDEFSRSKRAYMIQEIREQLVKKQRGAE